MADVRNIIVLSVALTLAVTLTRVEGGGVNGGVNCAACTAIVGLVEQYAEVHNTTIVNAMDKLCSFLPSEVLRPACNYLVSSYGAQLVELLADYETADVACHGIGFCKQDQPGPPQCHLFPLPRGAGHVDVSRFAKKTMRKNGRFSALPAICDKPEIKPLCDLISRFANDHEPSIDLDGDGFSTIETFRGSSWRGRDCNDVSKDFHPGRRPIDSDRDFDSNCNGIFGVDDNGKPYEDLLCGDDTVYRGIAILGDSAAAHFHLPPEWVTASALDEDVFKYALFALENELDWPMMSSATGYKNSTWNVIDGPVDSSYLRYVQKNRCMHRDYQNIAVNGARAGAMNDSIVKSLSRRQDTDLPLTVFLALIGNDVCNGHPDTLAHMTDPTSFYDSNVAIIKHLDTVLPAGSQVVTVGLVDGRILYEAMHDRIHPIGLTRNDVTYVDFYNYLNCLQVSPCTGWMNSNSTLRDLTTDHAFTLNDALKSAAASLNGTLSNIDGVFYMDDPINDAVKEWEKRGGQMWQLIEPVDGFHPNQIANALTTDVVWKYIESNFPGLKTPSNPHNDDILKMFGDQGGY